MTSKLDRARATLKNYRERGDEAVANGVMSLVTVGSAGAMSYLNVRFGENDRLKVAGIDADLAGGLLFHALGFAGLGAARSGKAQMATMVFHGLGNGLLSCFAVVKAAEMAAQSTSAAGVAPQQMQGRQTRIPSAGGIYGRAAQQGMV